VTLFAVRASSSYCANPSPEPDNTETTRYVGQNSIPALLRETASGNEPQEVIGIRQDMQSLLGLDNSAPFPLMSSRHLDRLTSDISSELPSDREVMKWVSAERREDARSHSIQALPDIQGNPAALLGFCH
jgi:hypothetical protein